MDIRIDIKFIVGIKLFQICFGLFQVKLNFDKEIIIEIGDSVEYHKNDGSIEDWNCKNGKNPIALSSLLELSVKKAFVDHNDNLRLEFENGESLIIKADKDGYESYIIYYKKDFQVIY